MLKVQEKAEENLKMFNLMNLQIHFYIKFTRYQAGHEPQHPYIQFSWHPLLHPSLL